MNGHVGVGADGFGGVLGYHCYRNRNTESELLLVFSEAMIVASTWFRKKVKQKISMNRVVTGQWLTSYW